MPTSSTNCSHRSASMKPAQTIREARARKADSHILHNAIYGLAFLAGDTAGMAEEQQWYRGQAGGREPWGFPLRPTPSLSRPAEQGARVDQARRGLRHPRRQQGKRRISGGRMPLCAKRPSATSGSPAGGGHRTEARRPPARACRRKPGWLTPWPATPRARSRSRQDLNQRHPVDTQIQSLWLPAIRRRRRSIARIRRPLSNGWSRPCRRSSMGPLLFLRTCHA